MKTIKDFISKRSESILQFFVVINFFENISSILDFLPNFFSFCSVCVLFRNVWFVLFFHLFITICLVKLIQGSQYIIKIAITKSTIIYYCRRPGGTSSQWFSSSIRVNDWISLSAGSKSCLLVDANQSYSDYDLERGQQYWDTANKG